ncbi:MAG TPA: SBBP repeat-containing protein, partial [Acidobacteriota bacterium]
MKILNQRRAYTDRTARAMVLAVATVGLFGVCRQLADIPIRGKLQKQAVGIETAAPVLSKADAHQTLPERTGRKPFNSSSGRSTRAELLRACGSLPLGFEANRGQTDPEVKFLSRAPAYTLFLTSTEVVLVLRKPRQPESTGGDEVVLRMQFPGSNAAPHVRGLDELPGKVHYFIGNRPTDAPITAPSYRKVKYEEVYPGVDLIFYSRHGELEYDFVFAPGVDTNNVRLSFEGAEHFMLDGKGDLILQIAGGQVRMARPVLYQESGGVKHEISGGYAIRDRSEVAFRVDDYDVASPLVVDPVLSYSTYVGGSDSDVAHAIALDTQGNAYIAGETRSIDLPSQTGISTGAFGKVFIAKINAAADFIVYTIILGGTKNLDRAFGVAVDAEGYVYVTGEAGSDNFPTRNAFQSFCVLGSLGGCQDAFVAKIDPTGTELIYSTFYGTPRNEFGNAIAVDSLGNVYVAASGRGSDSDVFVLKLNPSGIPFYARSFVGRDLDSANGIAVDSRGNIYVTGTTHSTDFPVRNALQPTNGGGTLTAIGGGGPFPVDAFVMKLDSNGSILYSTYLGGSGDDTGMAVAADADGNAYITGMTSSNNFPTSSPFQPSLAGGSPPVVGNLAGGDAFVAKLNPIGSALVYSTYLGGSGNDAGADIAVDAQGFAYVAGSTASTDFPTARALQQRSGGNADAFLIKLNASGASLEYATHIGGSGDDVGNSVAVDSAGNAYVAGGTSSGDFPVTNLQVTKGG